MRLTFLRQARIDLADIHQDIALDNPEAADRTVDRIRTALNRLRDFPMSARSRGELGRGIRGMTIANYIAYYRVDTGEVRVLRILHGARDAAAIFRP